MSDDSITVENATNRTVYVSDHGPLPAGERAEVPDTPEVRAMVNGGQLVQIDSAGRRRGVRLDQREPGDTDSPLPDIDKPDRTTEES
jgi:hypothetical protein